ALSLKFTAAYILLPLAVVVIQPRSAGKLLLAVACVLPAALWYAYAGQLLARGGASAGTAAPVGQWMETLTSRSLFAWEAYRVAGRYLLLTAFTPLGLGLAVWGFLSRRPRNALWAVWALGLLAALAILAGKLYHEYYLLGAAPLVAVGIAKALADGFERGGVLRGAAAL